MPQSRPPLPVPAAPRIRDDVPLESIAAADWDALVPGQPLLAHAFLGALHATGCASPETGWEPHYLTAWDGARLVGAMPLYRKTHSYGEYVFDWAWAEAYRRHGLRYYPKLVAAIPFTPVAGPRLLGAPTAGPLLVARALDAMRDTRCSSLHVLFHSEDDGIVAQARGMIGRGGVQFHWENRGYRSFDEFLGAMNHDKRKKIRQERRKLAESGVRFVRKTGTEIDADDWAFFFRCYRATYRAHQSTPYLTLDFFRRIGATMPAHVVLVVGERTGGPICAALDIFDDRTLWGRYWGTLEPVPGLHFEACYYQAIEFCIERGIPRFEGGAQGAHKLARGLLPASTRSSHAIADPSFAAAIARFCEHERTDVSHAMDELGESSPFRRPPAGA